MAWYSGIKKVGDAVGKFMADTVDSLQMALDVLGYVPVVGTIPDLANGFIYAARGDTKNMLLSAGCAVPGIGDAAGFLKASKNAAKAVKAARIAKTARTVKTVKTAKTIKTIKTLKAVQKAEVPKAVAATLTKKAAASAAVDGMGAIKGMMIVGADAVKPPKLPMPEVTFAKFKRWSKKELLKGTDNVSKKLDDVAKAASKGGTKSVGDVLKGAKETTNGAGVARNFEKTGGFNQTLKDFESLNPTNVKNIQTKYGAGKVGQLSDGTSVVARPGSATGGSTLEIKVSNSKVYKIRYGD